MSASSMTTVSAAPFSTSRAVELRVHPIMPAPAHPASHPVLRLAPWLRRDPWRKRALGAIRVVHSLVFFGEELSVGYLLYAGLRKRQGRAAAVAGPSRLRA
ncbi:MAG TPA: hypothetical protein VF116_13780 [Ktedonobacterales bacterium]